MNYLNPYYGNNQYMYANQQPAVAMPPPIQPQIPQQQMSQYNPNMGVQQNGLNGKIVDSEEVVKATEVPVGGYGIFPRADLSEIYIKSWNNNGTTSVIAYKPVIQEPRKEEPDFNQVILQKIDMLENKIDSFLAMPSQPVMTVESSQKPEIQQNQVAPQVIPKKVEVINNG